MEWMELLKSRRSYRRFDEGRPVPPAVLSDILTAQRYASSARNSQELRFLAVQSPPLVQAIFPLTRWAGALPPELGVPKAGERPVLYVLVLRPRDSANPYLDTDAGLAIANMTLAAWAHGVGSCILGSVDRPKAQALLDIDPAYDVHTAVAFGYPTHAARVVEGAAGALTYSLDENGDYRVPKLPLSETTRVL